MDLSRKRIKRAFDSSFDSNGAKDPASAAEQRRTVRRRGNAEGTIYRRGDGRWVAAVTDPRTGRQRCWYSQTRTGAAEKLNKALRARDDGLQLTNARQTLGDYLKRWEQEVARLTVRPSTFSSYAGIIRHHLVPTLGKVPLSKLDPEHVQVLMRRKLADGLSTRRVLYIRAVLRKALGDAVRWGLISRNAAGLARGPKHEPGEVQPLSPAEVGHFLDSVDDDRLVALYTVAVALGLRQGELLGLRWDDVDLDAGLVRVRAALQRIDGTLQLVPLKTHRSRRTVHLPLLVTEALIEHKDKQAAERLLAGRKWTEHGFIFTTLSGGPLCGGTVTHAFQRHLAAAGLPRHRFHDLRHTCASSMLAEGVNPRVVMDVLGHSQVSITLNTYSHVMPEVQREAMDRMDALLRSNRAACPSAGPSFGPSEAQLGREAS